MALEELLSRFAVALGIGLLIGLERGWRARDERSGSRAAGLRTFGIAGLLGALVGALSAATGGAVGGGVLIGVSLAAFAAVVTVFCMRQNRADGTYSATTAIAAILTFALGAYTMLGDMRVAAAVAVVAAGLLAFREGLHGWIKTLTWPELRSGLILLAMTFIALPVIPDRPVGPWGGVNPRQIWLIAIVLAGVSFLGFVAVKYFGARRGVLLAATAGGLVSSTAVTLANARRAASGEGSPRLLAAGVALASAVSFMRVLAIAAALSPDLLAWLAPPLGAATVTTVVLALFWSQQQEPADSAIETAFRNPFGFWSVIMLALAMGAIILAGRALNQTLGAAGAIVGAATLGLFDLDAITVSITRLVPEPLSLRVAASAILAAVASNTVSKLAIGAGLGRGAFARHIVVFSLAGAAAAALALWAALLFAPAR